MKVALLQQEFKGTKEATIAKTLELIAEAKKGGADLVVCQELHQTQYFCQSEDTNFFDHANDWQEDVAFWGRVAKENGVVLVTSLFEKRADGLYHNTAFVFERDRSDEQRQKQRKQTCSKQRLERKIKRDAKPAVCAVSDTARDKNHAVYDRERADHAASDANEDARQQGVLHKI